VKDILSRVDEYLNFYQIDKDYKLARGFLVGIEMEEYSGCYYDIKELLKRLPNSQKKSYETLRKRLEKKFTEHIEKGFDTFLMDLDKIANSSLARYLPEILELRSTQVDEIVNSQYTLTKHPNLNTGPVYKIADLLNTAYGRMVVDSLNIIEPITEDELEEIRAALRKLNMHVNW